MSSRCFFIDFHVWAFVFHLEAYPCLENEGSLFVSWEAVHNSIHTRYLYSYVKVVNASAAVSVFFTSLTISALSVGFGQIIKLSILVVNQSVLEIQVLNQFI